MKNTLINKLSINLDEVWRKYLNYMLDTIINLIFEKLINQILNVSYF